MIRPLLMTFSLLLSFSAYGAEEESARCPSPDTRTPLCPTGSSMILDDTYPTSAVVISNQTAYKNNNSEKTTSTFIMEVINAYKDNLENMPMIIVPCKDCFEKIREQLRSQIKRSVNYRDNQIESILSKVRQSKTKSYTWQQDYFESFYDRATGRPVTRRFASYNRNKGGYKQLTKTMGKLDCGIKSDRTLKSDPGSYGKSEYGGNIEGLPGGGCLFGNNVGKNFPKQFCPNPEDQVRVDVDFLHVGHVDELFKITPGNKRPGVPKECNFTINYASPAKGIELLEKSKDQIIYPKTPRGGKERFAFLNNRLQKLCYIIKASRHQNTPTNMHGHPVRNDESHESRGVFFKLFDFVNSHAEDRHENKSPRPNSCYPDDVHKLSTKDFARGIKNIKPLYKLNMAIDKNIKKNLEKIKRNILKRLPQCEGKIDTLAVPDIYNCRKPKTNFTAEERNRKTLDRNGDCLSFFPSPTNGVFLNKTMIFSDSEVSPFKNYLKKEMKLRNNKAVFVPTYEYSHLMHGNLHCSSHTLPYCRPRTGKQK